jgi:hypothetical protein
MTDKRKPFAGQNVKGQGLPYPAVSKYAASFAASGFFLKFIDHGAA